MPRNERENMDRASTFLAPASRHHIEIRNFDRVEEAAAVGTPFGPILAGPRVDPAIAMGEL